MSTETTLMPVTFVRDLPADNDVFTAGTVNKLWQTEDGDYITTSWASAEHEDHIDAETMAYVSEEDGEPSNPMVYFGDFPGVSATVEDQQEQHEAALNKLGYEVRA